MSQRDIARKCLHFSFQSSVTQPWYGAPPWTGVIISHVIDTSLRIKCQDLIRRELWNRGPQPYWDPFWKRKRLLLHEAAR